MLKLIKYQPLFGMTTGWGGGRWWRCNFFLRESSFNFPSTGYSIITGNHLSSKIMPRVAGGGGWGWEREGLGARVKLFCEGLVYFALGNHSMMTFVFKTNTNILSNRAHF